MLLVHLLFSINCHYCTTTVVLFSSKGDDSRGILLINLFYFIAYYACLFFFLPFFTTQGNRDEAAAKLKWTHFCSAMHFCFNCSLPFCWDCQFNPASVLECSIVLGERQTWIQMRNRKTHKTLMRTLPQTLMLTSSHLLHFFKTADGVVRPAPCCTAY